MAKRLQLVAESQKPTNAESVKARGKFGLGGKHMNKCTFCGREGEWKTKNVGGYEILEVCSDCEVEILEGES